MKKILVFGLAVLVLIFAGVHFMNRGGDVRNVERMTAENTLYTQEEIDTAMDIPSRLSLRALKAASC